MKQQLTLEQLAELPIVRDYLARQLAGDHEALRNERLQMLATLRSTEAECVKIDAEAEEARKALEIAQKAWESARGVCGAIAAKRTAAWSRYQRAHKRLLDLGERTIEDAIRKVGAAKAAIEGEISRIDSVLQRDSCLRPHEVGARMKPARKRELMLEVNAHRAALQPLSEVMAAFESMRHAEMSPGEIVEQVAALIESSGLDTTNISGLRIMRAA